MAGHGFRNDRHVRFILLITCIKLAHLATGFGGGAAVQKYETPERLYGIGNYQRIS